MAKTRIQKLLADLGIASRRHVEEMILEGRITVNREAIRKLPCFVDPEQDEIHLDGRRVKLRARLAQARKVYFLLNKPRGVVCTQSDPEGRPKAIDLLPPMKERLYCVGRLDKDSTGVLILTNDGELTNRLTHPRYGVVKTYTVRVDGRVSGEDLDKMKHGYYLEGKRLLGAEVKILRRGFKETWLEVKLREGRNREIRRMLEGLGYKVRRLKRTAIGPIDDRGIKIGNYRPLSPVEVRKLKNASQRGGEEE